jgi:hypothetical protein
MNPRERPPDGMRSLFKKYQKSKDSDLCNDLNVIDATSVDGRLANELKPAKLPCLSDPDCVFRDFLSNSSDRHGSSASGNISAFEVTIVPG